MSWFSSTSSFTSLAKSALNQAQKQIDKVLEIDDASNVKHSSNKGFPSKDTAFVQEPVTETDSFFSTFLGEEKPRSTNKQANLSSSKAVSATPITRKPRPPEEHSRVSKSKPLIGSLSAQIKKKEPDQQHVPVDLISYQSTGEDEQNNDSVPTTATFVTETKSAELPSADQKLQAISKDDSDEVIPATTDISCESSDRSQMTWSRMIANDSDVMLDSSYLVKPNEARALSSTAVSSTAATVLPDSAAMLIDLSAAASLSEAAASASLYNLQTAFPDSSTVTTLPDVPVPVTLPASLPDLPPTVALPGASSSTTLLDSPATLPDSSASTEIQGTCNTSSLQDMFSTATLPDTCTDATLLNASTDAILADRCAFESASLPDICATEKLPDIPENSSNVQTVDMTTLIKGELLNVSGEDGLSMQSKIICENNVNAINSNSSVADRNETLLSPTIDKESSESVAGPHDTLVQATQPNQVAYDGKLLTDVREVTTAGPVCKQPMSIASTDHPVYSESELLAKNEKMWTLSPDALQVQQVTSDSVDPCLQSESAGEQSISLSLQLTENVFHNLEEVVHPDEVHVVEEIKCIDVTDTNTASKSTDEKLVGQHEDTNLQEITLSSTSLDYDDPTSLDEPCSFQENIISASSFDSVLSQVGGSATDTSTDTVTGDISDNAADVVKQDNSVNHEDKSSDNERTTDCTAAEPLILDSEKSICETAKTSVTLVPLTEPVEKDIDECKTDDTSVSTHEEFALQNDQVDKESVDSSSFVQCLISEAITEVDNHHQSFHSPTSSDPSEPKQQSGHTSSDDMETAASSDIEVISLSACSDGNGHRYEISPMRQLLPRHKGHRRTESDDSVTSRKVPLDTFLHQPVDQAVTSIAGDPQQIDRLLKKLAETMEILQAREDKLLDANKEAISLRETNNILRNQIVQLEAAAENIDVDDLTEEFTARIADAERRLQAASRERDSVKRQLKLAQEELSSRLNASETSLLLSEKEEQIKGLLTEGEKLSKQNLQQSTVIKKLRTKEKEHEVLLQKQKEKLDEQSAEIERLHKVLDAREEMEKKHVDAIKQLNALVTAQKRELSIAKTEVEESQDKMKSMQATLDTSYKEIAELNKCIISKESLAEDAKLSAEMAMKEEMRIAVEKAVQQANEERDVLLMKIDDLQKSLSRMELQHSRRQDQLRLEISDLQERLQESETRCQELTQSVSQATRPLLRQIENFQSHFDQQSHSWEAIEKNLNDRILDTQCQLAAATEKGNMLSERCIELTSTVASLESQTSLLRQEKSTAIVELNTLKAKLETVEENHAKDMCQYRIAEQKFQDQISDLKRQGVLFENQLEMERLKVETEKKKLVLAHKALTEKERSKYMRHESQTSIQSPGRASPTGSLPSMSDSMDPLSVSVTQDEATHDWMVLSPSGSMVRSTSLQDTFRYGSSSALIEHFQSTLKQKDGELAQLQADITRLEDTRESMAKELVDVSSKNNELEEKVAEIPGLKKNYEELQTHYNAVLQMYGEKEEQVEELRLDLQDVKEMYRTQISQLMAEDEKR